MAVFLSTPSARRATKCFNNFHLTLRISIHALREEGDAKNMARPVARTISIHALREEGDFLLPPRPKRPGPISIHALREEGDCSGAGTRCCPSDFYPRPPRGGRPSSRKHCRKTAQFLSTPSARRATPAALPAWAAATFLSTPSARRATGGTGMAANLQRFLSTPSARRATGHLVKIAFPGGISIHALREEGDVGFTLRTICTSAFLSTPSARRATQQYMFFSERSSNFYPRPPRGGRPDYPCRL